MDIICGQCFSVLQTYEEEVFIFFPLNIVFKFFTYDSIYGYYR